MKQWTEAEIRDKLATDEKWVRRALIRLLKNQTDSEQRSEATNTENNIGFQSCDAKWFTRLAKYVQKYPDKPLSPKQLKIVRRPWRGEPAICKYAGQLLSSIRAEVPTVQVVPAISVQPDTCGYCGEEHPCRCHFKREFQIREAQQEQAAFEDNMQAEMDYCGARV